MIQRIQSVFLLLAAASFGGLLSFPLAISDKPTAQFLADSVYDITDHIALSSVTSLSLSRYYYRWLLFYFLQMNLQSWIPQFRSMIRLVCFYLQVPFCLALLPFILSGKMTGWSSLWTGFAKSPVQVMIKSSNSAACVSIASQQNGRLNR